MMQHHMQSVQKPVVKCKACKPKAEHKIIIENTQNNQSNSHSITARNIAKHTRTDRVTVSNLWATPGLEEATLNNMQVSSENTQAPQSLGMDMTVNLLGFLVRGKKDRLSKFAM